MRLLPVLFAIVFILSSARLRADVVIAVAPASQTVAVGTTTEVQVGISGLGLDEPPSLGAFDLNLAFDPAILTFTGLTFGDPVQGDQLDLSGAGAISDFSNEPAGMLEFFEVSLDSATVLNTQQSGHFVLVTLQFQATAGGTSGLMPSLNSISDSEGMPLQVGLRAGSIDVVPTPEPHDLWLFSGAAACMTWRLRRLKRFA